jgi:dipeptidase E
MRLFLSSSHLSSSPHELSGLVKPGARVVVVANALDNLPDFPRAGWLDNEYDGLAQLGLSAYEVDLREHYAEPKALHEALADSELVWVTGGNVFVLRDAMRRSGLDVLLQARLREDSIAYGGYSAGACVTAPTLRGGIELVDDAGAVTDPIWEGLGLVSFSFAPHYRSDDHQAQDIDRVVAYLQASEMPYRAVHDGQAIVVRDETERLVGECTSS